MDSFTISPTSRDSAQCEVVVLRETSLIRLVFKPLLVNSIHDQSAAIKGTFIYQRKRKSREWEDVKDIQLSSLKSGEGFQLQVTSSELLALVRELNGLYELHQVDGIPRHKTVFLKTDAHVTGSLEINEDELRSFLELNQKAGVDFFSKLLDWAVRADHSDAFIQKLESLGVNSLQKLNSAVGLSSLKNALAIWKDNEANPAEEFWQTTLSQNSFVLSQIFSYPVVVLNNKAYVGGKGINNSGGNVVDFLCATDMTQNAILVEIKTPKTNILGKQYRGDIYNTSTDLSGAAMQASNYKDSLVKEYDSLSRRSAISFEAFNPPCLVIIGNAGAELIDTKRRKSFELYRNQLKDVQIITFDELFRKVEILISLLEEGSTS